MIKKSHTSLSSQYLMETHFHLFPANGGSRVLTVYLFMPCYNGDACTAVQMAVLVSTIGIAWSVPILFFHDYPLMGFKLLPHGGCLLGVLHLKNTVYRS